MAALISSWKYINCLRKTGSVKWTPSICIALVKLWQIIYVWTHSTRACVHSEFESEVHLTWNAHFLWFNIMYENVSFQKERIVFTKNHYWFFSPERHPRLNYLHHCRSYLFHSEENKPKLRHLPTLICIIRKQPLNSTLRERCETSKFSNCPGYCDHGDIPFLLRI